MARALFAATLLLPVAACGRPDGAPPAPVRPAPLEALGYAGYVAEVAADRPSGVVAHDAVAVAPGWNLVSVHRRAEALLFDAQGTLLHRWHTDGKVWGHCELLDDGRLLVPEVGADGRYTLRCLDWDGATLWNVDVRAHHDVELRGDGRVVTLSYVDGRSDPELGALPFRDEAVAVLDGATGALEEEHFFHELRRAAPQEFPLIDQRWVESPRRGEQQVDLWHANSVEWMHRPELEARAPFYGPGHALVSFRHQQRVAIFDLEQGRVAWSWGLGEIHGSHDASVLEDGHVLIFDNGLGRGWSRAVEVDPLTDAIVWEYRADPPEDFYTESRGAAQRLANGNTLLAESDRGHAIEVTPDGRIVWEYWHPGENDRVATLTRIKRIEPAQVAALRAGPAAGLPPLD